VPAVYPPLSQERKAVQNAICPRGQQERVMVDKAPTRTVPQRGRPRRSPPAQGVRLLTIRVPEELLRRLDAYTAQLQAAQPYLRLSRADVLRMLLDQGLSATS
jgi:hypothetical protein